VVRAQLAWLKKKLFGGGQSEKTDRAQLPLQLEELEKTAPAPAPTQTIAYERRTPQPAERKVPAEAFAHLPVQETVEIVPALVRADPARYERIGEERTFEVDVVPPKLFKREIVRPKFRDKRDRTQPPVVAPAPARPVPGGHVAAGLLAWVAVAKYADHLPLFRQEKMLRRWGAPIARQTLCDWIGKVTEWLEPLQRCLHRDLLEGGYLQVDETPVRCNDPDHPQGGTSQGWLWALSRPGGDVAFFWRLSRRHGELPPLLKDYHGLLHSDGYEAYAAFASTHDKVVWLGCWAHARRKFHEALQEAPARAGFILHLIGQLYHWEKQWDRRRVGPDLRTALRQSHFALTLRLLKRVAQHLLGRVLPKSLLGQACAYLLNHWTPLTAHCDHGRSKLDTNSVENAIRPSALGKKNWLFVGHPDAGDRAAVLYSLIVSCQRRGIDPFAYLKDVLARLPAMTNQHDLSVLTPAKWKPA